MNKSDSNLGSTILPRGLRQLFGDFASEFEGVNGGLKVNNESF
jgi:hypothetical protein